MSEKYLSESDQVSRDRVLTLQFLQLHLYLGWAFKLHLKMIFKTYYVLQNKIHFIG